MEKKDLLTWINNPCTNCQHSVFTCDYESCDRYKNWSKLIDYIDNLESDCELYKKAFKKACKRLEEDEWQSPEDHHFITSEEWEERLLIGVE